MRDAVQRLFGAMLEIVEDRGLLRFVAGGAEGADFVFPILSAAEGGANKKRCETNHLDIIASSDMCRHECLLYVYVQA